MKIYNKKIFLVGVFLLLLDILLLTANICGVRELDIVTLQWFITLTILGLTSIIRSMDRKTAREDKINERDERNRFVKLRAQSRALEIGQWACFGLGFAVNLWGKFNAPGGALFYIGFGLMLSFLVLASVHFCTWLYYEEHT